MLTALKQCNRVRNYRISTIIFLFFLLFSPPVIPHVNSGALACVIATILLITRFRKDLFLIFKQSGALLFAAFFGLFLLYLAATTFFNIFLIGHKVQLLHYLKLWYRLFLVCPLLVAASLYLCLRFRELKTTARQICGYFICTVLLQFIMVIVCLLFPTVKSTFTEWIYLQTGDSYLNIPWVMARRGFGFANSFVDSFGWGIGLVASMPLFLIKKNNPWHILLCPLLLFVSLVNARTGLVVFGIALVLFTFFVIRLYKKSTRKEKLKLLLAIFSALIILTLLCLLLYVTNPITLQWILGDLISFVPQDGTPNALQEVLQQFADDSETTTAEVLFSAGFWNLPTGSPFIFGAGHTLYGARGYAHSDVGYINDLWMGGIIGCVLLYGAFLLLFRRAWHRTDSLWQRLFILFLGISMVVFQIKANAISFSAGLNVTLPVLLIFSSLKSNSFSLNLSNECKETVSIIVPIYKVEKELPKCIKSIQSQSYPYLEILLIDDASPDRCPLICDEFALCDNRIKVIHKPNGGLSDARNAGIEASTGKYIAFVDSDDFLHPDFILTLLSLCKTNNTPIAAVGYTRYFNKGLQIAPVDNKSNIVSSVDAIRDLFLGKHSIDVMAWNKLYRADLFADDIRFPVGLIHEDVATTYRLLHRAKSISYVGLPYYFYRQRKGSIVNQPFSKKRFDLLEAVAGIEPFVAANPIYRDAYRFYVFYNHLTLLHSMLEQKAERKQICALKDATLQLYEALKRENSPFISRKMQYAMLICKKSLWLYTALHLLRRRFAFYMGVLS